jgi:hypothetical protein
MNLAHLCAWQTWIQNSVISTALAKYVCLVIKNFYFMAVLKYFEYMMQDIDKRVIHSVLTSVVLLSSWCTR